MKKLLYILLFVPLALFGQENDLYHIPDTAFLSLLQANHPDVIYNDSLDILSASNLSNLHIHNYNSYDTIYDTNYSVYNLDGLQYFYNLDSLKITSCSITSLPNISNLSNLTYLQISHNSLLSNIPDLSDLSNLQTLMINQNLIDIFPELPINLKNLIIFELNSSLPNLSNLSVLEDLGFWGTSLTNYPQDFLYGLDNLTSLTFQYSHNLTDLPDLTTLDNLSFFGLVDCPELVSIPDLSNLNDLAEFRIQMGTSLTSVSDLPDNLSILSFQNTPFLTQISELPIGLEYFELFNTGIESIPELISLTNLVELKIVYNDNLGIIPDLPLSLETAVIIGNENLICIGTYPESFESSLGQYPKCSDGIIYQLNELFDAWNVSIDLSEGWNMFGYGCPNPIEVAEGLSNHTESIAIVKDNNGSVYMPEFGFNGIGDFTPGFGYQIKLTEAIEGFSLCNWYVNYIPIDTIISLQQENNMLLDNIVSLQEENSSLVDSLISLHTTNCIENGYCSFDSYNQVCISPEYGFDCNGDSLAYVGMEAFGGIIFYIDSTGLHGLVAALEDNEQMWDWGCYGTEMIGANGIEIGTGYQNTLDITSGCLTSGDIAANIALAFESEGYDDWYLPSQNELIEMYNTIGPGGLYGNIGGFSVDGWTELYWSSTEINSQKAFFLNFGGGNTTANKYDSMSVRPIRSF